MSEQQNQSSPTETVTDPVFNTMYFPVSPLKLIVMSICTFGVYQLFWSFSNWYMIKEREESNISPIWRAIFGFVFCYPLFKRIRATAESRQLGRPLAAGPLAAGWVIFAVLDWLPEPLSLVAFFSVLFLLPVQKTVNMINLATDPGHDPNSSFTGWNIACVVIGGLVWVLAFIGLFLPSQMSVLNSR